MVDVKQKISSLNLDKNIEKKLVDNNINIIEDLWLKKRKDLKETGFSDKEIKSIIISLQLQGLDLNRKKYKL